MWFKKWKALQPGMHQGPKECLYVLWVQLFVNCTHRGAHSPLQHMWLWSFLLHFPTAMLCGQPDPPNPQPPTSQFCSQPQSDTLVCTLVVQLYTKRETFTFVSYSHLSLIKLSQSYFTSKDAERQDMSYCGRSWILYVLQFSRLSLEQFRMEF